MLKEINNSSGVCGNVVMGIEQLEKMSLDLAAESAVKMRDYMMGRGFKNGGG